METVTKYRTSDGQEFEDREVAEYHEAVLSTAIDVGHLFGSQDDFNAQTVCGIIEFLQRNDNLDKLEAIIRNR